MNAPMQTPKQIVMAVLLLLTAPAAFGEPVEVVFFGGHASTPAQMQCWEKGARAENGSRSDDNFRGIAYPAGAHYSQQAALEGSRAEVQKIVDEINSHPTKRYVIAGHSSGAAISNRVASLVKNPRQIDLVNLDGFAPSSALQERVGSSTCWYAVNPALARSSLNASSMRGCRSSAKIQSSSCVTPMCLHFALVNKGAPAQLRNYRAEGYTSCRTNLDWLPTRPAPVSAAPRLNAGARAASVR